MSIRNEHRNAERIGRPAAFNLNAASRMAFCNAPDFWDTPNAETDMFTRWIRLSDKLLAANTPKKAASRIRRKVSSVFSGKSA
jgi:hypothetical protein